MSFDRMLDNISDAYEKQRRFVSDASQAARRWPSSGLRGYAVPLGQGGQGGSQRGHRRHKRAEQLHESAGGKAAVSHPRAGSGFSVEYKHFDFEELAAEIIETLKW